MGTTAQKLQKLADTKAAIGQVITGAGGTLPQKFADYTGALSGIIGALNTEIDDLVFFSSSEPARTYTIRAPSTFDGSVLRDYALFGRRCVVGVYLPASITRIGVHALYNTGITRLTDEMLPGARTLDKNCCQTCPDLVSVDLSAAGSIQDYAFANCPALTSVSLPNATVFQQYAVYADPALTSINLPKASTIGKSAFTGCTALTSLELPAAKTLSNKPFGTMQSDSTNASRKLRSLVSLSLPSLTSFTAGLFGYNASLPYTALADLYLPHKTMAEVKAMSNYGTCYLQTTCTIHCTDGSFTYGS